MSKFSLGNFDLKEKGYDFFLEYVQNKTLVDIQRLKEIAELKNIYNKAIEKNQSPWMALKSVREYLFFVTRDLHSFKDAFISKRKIVWSLDLDIITYGSSDDLRSCLSGYMWHERKGKKKGYVVQDLTQEAISYLFDKYGKYEIEIKK